MRIEKFVIEHRRNYYNMVSKDKLSFCRCSVNGN